MFLKASWAGPSKKKGVVFLHYILYLWLNSNLHRCRKLLFSLLFCQNVSWLVPSARDCGIFQAKPWCLVGSKKECWGYPEPSEVKMETLCNQRHLATSPRFGQHWRCSLTDEAALWGSNDSVNKIAKCSLRPNSFIPLDNKTFEVYNLAAAHLACSLSGRSLDMPIRHKKRTLSMSLCWLEMG